MPFNLDKFNRVSSGNNTNSFLKYSYRTEDSQTEIAASDYFSELRFMLREDDVIETFSTTDSQDIAYRSYVVTSVSPTVETVSLRGGDTFSYIDIPMSAQFFNGGVGGLNTYATIPANLAISRSFRLKGIRWLYSGDIVPNAQMQIGLTLDSVFLVGMIITPTVGKDSAEEFTFNTDHFLNVSSEMFTSIVQGVGAPQLNHMNVRVFLEEV